MPPPPPAWPPCWAAAGTQTSSSDAAPEKMDISKVDLFIRDLPPANAGWLDYNLILLLNDCDGGSEVAGLINLLGSGIGCDASRFHPYAFEDEVFHLGPDVGIAFALHVVGSDVAVEPG